VIPLNNFLILSTILFSLGMYGVLARRSAVLILMSVELMLQAVSINFIAFAFIWTRGSRIIFAVFRITVAAVRLVRSQRAPASSEQGHRERHEMDM
jgi:NADH:ubiquinone oxidoreductase subunit K